MKINPIGIILLFTGGLLCGEDDGKIRVGMKISSALELVQNYSARVLELTEEEVDTKTKKPTGILVHRIITSDRNIRIDSDGKTKLITKIVFQWKDKKAHAEDIEEKSVNEVQFTK